MTAGAPNGARRAGLLLPLFSCPSRWSWGIGEFADVPLVAAWMREAGFSVLQVLPLNELVPGQHSPYSAVSSMALDPIFISLRNLPDFLLAGGEAALGSDEQFELDDLRSRRHVPLDAVRALKDRVLRRGFARFERDELGRQTPRAEDFRRFLSEQRWWLEDYALFRALHASHQDRAWFDWPEGERFRAPGALDAARQMLAGDVRYRCYLQWVAHRQWTAARAVTHGVRVLGDYPFAVAADSADTWAHQDVFAFDGTIGAPPDAFSADGQNWKLPVYRWDVMAARAFEWFGWRAKRMADLFDGYRIDHVVGLFRTWVFPLDGSAPHFVPGGEAAQRAQGRAVLQVIRACGGEIIAEDLGTIPDFVRDELRDQGIPGFKVLRWEREWDAPGQPFRDPRTYPALSVATTGTHDTDTLSEWWDRSSMAERKALTDVPSLHTHGAAAGTHAFGGLHRPVLEALYASGADLLLLPMQDVFGWTDRVNTPGIVDDRNWTWRLPWPVDALASQPDAVTAASGMRRLAEAHRRL